MNKIPYDIIINYIAPFTYSVQNKELRKDITTYVFILNSLKKLYILNNISNFDLDSILYFNLINYCMSNKLDFCKYINKNPSITTRNRYILGKFKPLDRLKFLNTTHYIEL